MGKEAVVLANLLDVHGEASDTDVMPDNVKVQLEALMALEDTVIGATLKEKFNNKGIYYEQLFPNNLLYRLKVKKIPEEGQFWDTMGAQLKASCKDYLKARPGHKDFYRFYLMHLGQMTIEKTNIAIGSTLHVWQGCFKDGAKGKEHGETVEATIKTLVPLKTESSQ